MTTDNSKKIALVTCAWPPNGGGFGNNAYYQVKKLAGAGWSVGAFTIAFKGIEAGPFDFKFKALPAVFQIGKAGFLVGLLKELKDYQIIHLYYPFFGTDLLVAGYKIFKPQTKLVVHYHMDPVATGVKGMIFKVWIKLFLGLLVQLADRVAILSYDHAENTYIAKYLKRYPEKFFVLPNGIDTEIFQPAPKSQSLRELYKISVQDKVALFVGGLDDQHYFKGVPVLLKAFAQIRQGYFPDPIGGEAIKGQLSQVKGLAYLMIIGDGNLRGEFEALARELGITDKVIFTGWVKNNQLPEYYNLCDVFILPSTERIESFGIVVGEAQACGKPALVANWPGVRQTIIDGETGYLLEPSNELDLKNKLQKLFDNQELATKLGAQAIERIDRLYGWQQVTANLSQVYLEL